MVVRFFLELRIRSTYFASRWEIEIVNDLSLALNWLLYIMFECYTFLAAVNLEALVLVTLSCSPEYFRQYVS